MPPLPRELSDLIIDKLQDCHGSLISCSAVCRSWSHRSRVHLIHNISFNCNAPQTEKRILSLDFCLSNDPLLSDHVHSIALLNMSLCRNLSTAAYEVSLPRILNALNRVQRLTLQDVDWPFLPAPIAHALRALLSCQYLSTVKFIGFVGPTTPAAISSLYSTPPNLKVLKLDDVTSEDRGAWDSVPIVPEFEHPRRSVGKPSIETLHIDTPVGPWMLHCLFHQDASLNLTNLRHLHLTKFNTRPQAVGKLLKLVGQTLEHLEIHAYSWHNHRNEPFGFCLADLPQLCRLMFTHGVTEAAVREFFLGIRESHPLREIIVKMPGLVVMNPDWAEPYFMQPTLRGIQKVEYVISDAHLADPRYESFSAWFPALRERGIFTLRTFAATEG